MFDYINYLYGIGLGPGDPELITLKALRIIRECDVLILPDSGRARSILEGILTPEELCAKQLIEVQIPMSPDSINIEDCYERAVNIIWPLLDRNLMVGYLTIGDPTLYSSFAEIKKRLEFNGYRTKIINGIPSFLSVASVCNQILVKGNDELHINSLLSDSLGTLIYMKNKSGISSLLTKLSSKSENESINVFGASNASLPSQKVYLSLDKLLSDPPDSYYSTIIVKTNNEISE